MADDHLQKQYSPSHWAKRFSKPEEHERFHIHFCVKESAKMCYSSSTISYGASERQKFDIIGTNLKNDAPIFVFIHGGYWQTKEITRKSYHFIAANFFKNDIKTILVGYDLCPETPLKEIIKQIQGATKKILEYGIENQSRGVYIAGHSAGAHLAATLLLNNFMTSLSQEERNLIKKLYLLGGIYDLVPLLKTTYNDALKLSTIDAKISSPARQTLYKITHLEICVFVEEYESAEFIQQSRQFYDKLTAAGFDAQFFIVPNVDHFDMIENFYNRDAEITHKIVQQIKNNM